MNSFNNLYFSHSSKLFHVFYCSHTINTLMNSSLGLLLSRGPWRRQEAHFREGLPWSRQEAHFREGLTRKGCLSKTCKGPQNQSLLLFWSINQLSPPYVSQIPRNWALNDHIVFSMRFMHRNSILHSHSEMIVSHIFKIPPHPTCTHTHTHAMPVACQFTTMWLKLSLSASL